jgi:hypothetical protein
MKAERRLFTNFHRYVLIWLMIQKRIFIDIFPYSFRQVFCWLDRWHGMTMQDIRRLEDETREELDRVSSRIYLLILPLLLGKKKCHRRWPWNKSMCVADLVLAPSVSSLVKRDEANRSFYESCAQVFEYW